MGRKEIINQIINYLKKYNPKRIGIFGSFARGEENESSDLDILISFKKTLTLLQIVRIERELSELVGRKIDLITEPALKHPLIKENIEKDLQIIYQ